MPFLLASIFPKELLLKTIEKQNAYCCQKSIEKSTGVKKTKYKLAGNRFYEVYIFFILSSKNYGNKYTTLEIEEKDWENRKSKHLDGNGYLNVKNIETLTEEEIVSKLRSGSAYKVARLCNAKFIDLNDLCKQAGSQTSTSEEKKALLQIATISDIENISKENVSSFIDKYKI